MGILQVVRLWHITCTTDSVITVQSTFIKIRPEVAIYFLQLDRDLIRVRRACFIANRYLIDTARNHSDGLSMPIACNGANYGI